MRRCVFKAPVNPVLAWVWLAGLTGDDAERDRSGWRKT